MSNIVICAIFSVKFNRDTKSIARSLDKSFQSQSGRPNDGEPSSHVLNVDDGEEGGEAEGEERKTSKSKKEMKRTLTRRMTNLNLHKISNTFPIFLCF
jgi:hypothetical protein